MARMAEENTAVSARWTQADVDAANARISKGGWPTGEVDAMLGKSKYGNRKTGGYDSKREAKRAAELKAMERAGEITDLKEQVTFELIPKQIGERSCKYIADFQYRENGVTIVEDVKGYRDPIYRIKRKLMLQVHGLRVRET